MSARKRRTKEPEEVNQAWLLTYGDMVTLLMAFFVMLFAVSSIEQEKFEAFISGLGAFGNPGASPISESSSAGPPEPAIDPLPQPPDDSPPGADADALEQLGLDLLDAVAAAGHPGAIEITEDERGLAVSIKTDRVLFANGSAVVTQAGTEIIAAIAGPLRGVTNEILLEGHADNTPLNRNGYTNWNLSTDRAVAVVNVLVDRHQLPPQRLAAAGFGEFRPRDPGTSPEAKARNRRVELIVVADEAPVAAEDAPAETPPPDVAPSEAGLEDEVRAQIEAGITGGR